jgi:hypothetical protein
MKKPILKLNRLIFLILLIGLNNVFGQIKYIFKCDIYEKNTLDTTFFFKYKYVDSNVNYISYISKTFSLPNDNVNHINYYPFTSFNNRSVYDTIVNPFSVDNFNLHKETVIIKEYKTKEKKDSLSKSAPLIIEWYKPVKITKINDINCFEYEYYVTDYCCFDSKKDDLKSILKIAKNYSRKLKKYKIILCPIVFVPIYREMGSESFGDITIIGKNIELYILTKGYDKN